MPALQWDRSCPETRGETIVKISLAGMFKAIGGVVTSAPHGAAKPSRGIRRNVAMRPRVLNAGARVPYTGEQLREIRKRKGVGRPPEIGNEAALLGCKLYDAYTMSCLGIASPNLAEWNRKQRTPKMAQHFPARQLKAMRLPGVTRRQFDRERGLHAWRDRPAA